jgi:hypothetical protein
VRPQFRLPQHPVRRRRARRPVAAAPRQRPQHLLRSPTENQKSNLSSLSDYLSLSLSTSTRAREMGTAACSWLPPPLSIDSSEVVGIGNGELFGGGVRLSSRRAREALVRGKARRRRR